MLDPEGKTPRPEWANPYVPTWYGDQWIVQFMDESQAKRALLLLQMEMHAPRLMAAPMPDGDGWYVGVVG